MIVSCAWCEKQFSQPRGVEKFCSQRCSIKKGIQVRLENLRRTSVERFWQRIKVGSDDECWEWQGGRDKRGYGLLNFNTKRFLAHRLAYLLTKGELLADLEIMHTCDNPPCCNVRHLIQATHKENMQDAWAKGIIKPYPHPAGQDHNQAKLTDEDVLAIRASKERTISLAKHYGISRMTVYRIRNNLAWKHIPTTTAYVDGRLVGVRGAEHGMAALTEDDVRAIRSSQEKRSIIAAKYGVGASNISKIRARETWRHVP